MRIITLLVLGLVAAVSSGRAQEIKAPAAPLEGRIVFEEKGCITCHAINGFGGTEAPDLGRDHYYGSFLELASIIWNHIPEMNRKLRRLKMDRPQLSEQEMLSLSSFLYYLRYLGQPGSVARGRRLIETKQCLACHRVAGQGAYVGPDFGTLGGSASPVFMVQAMWNHGPAMQQKIGELKAAFPDVTGQDIDDISAYIRMATADGAAIRMSPGDPVRGRTIFVQKQCSDCHAVAIGEEKLGPNLAKSDLKKSVTEIAALMWNHSQVMREHMAERDIPWPEFDGPEMADLIAYLYFLGFEDHPGEWARGSDVFDLKGCAWCHERGGMGDGPDLATIRRLDSPVRMAQLMWNHASEMEDMVLLKDQEWPRLSVEEIQDMYAFLKKITQEKIERGKEPLGSLR
jgi:mono/diheme cytochrome c family protein